MANTLPVLVTSPTPLPLQREIMWGENIQHFDNGQTVGSTGWQRELYKWRFTFRNQQPAFVNSLTAFVCGRKGMTRLFFFSDPYDMHVNSQVLQNTGTATQTLELMHPVCSYHVFPNSAFLGTLTSALSGTLSLGIDYALDHDGGWITLNVTPHSGDYITVNSTQFYRKVRFDRNYADQSPLWQIFGGEVALLETF